MLRGVPAVRYPPPLVPAVVMTPARTGPHQPRTGQAEAAEAQMPGAASGAPAATSGPAGYSSPSGAMGTLGWGLRTRRFARPAATQARGIRRLRGTRRLADARQMHYGPPGTIPGPGGDLLILVLMRRTSDIPVHSTPQLTLATVAVGMKPAASSVRNPQGRSQRL